MTLDKLIKDVIAAKGSASKLHSILEPILRDANRLQHLDEMRNDILPWYDDAADYPMVNAAWLLRTKNGFKDVGLRTYIDDDKAYWEERRALSN